MVETEYASYHLRCVAMTGCFGPVLIRIEKPCFIKQAV